MYTNIWYSKLQIARKHMQIGTTKSEIVDVSFGYKYSNTSSAQIAVM